MKWFKTDSPEKIEARIAELKEQLASAIEQATRLDSEADEAIITGGKNGPELSDRAIAAESTVKRIRKALDIAERALEEKHLDVLDKQDREAAERMKDQILRWNKSVIQSFDKFQAAFDELASAGSGMADVYLGEGMAFPAVCGYSLVRFLTENRHLGTVYHGGVLRGIKDEDRPGPGEIEYLKNRIDQLTAAHIANRRNQNRQEADNV